MFVHFYPRSISSRSQCISHYTIVLLVLFLSGGQHLFKDELAKRIILICEQGASWTIVLPRCHVLQTGVILVISSAKMPEFANRGNLQNQYSQDARVYELLLGKKISFREQNRKNYCNLKYALTLGGI